MPLSFTAFGGKIQAARNAGGRRLSHCVTIRSKLLRRASRLSVLFAQPLYRLLCMMHVKLKLKSSGDIHKSLIDYRRLVARVDGMVHRIRRKYRVHIACHKGCACGCRNLSILPIEALSLSGALQDLPRLAIAAIRKRAAAVCIWECPLLSNGACSLYAFRPLICRTHGYPLLTHYQGRASIGYCRHNFKKMPSIPADAVIDLEKINGRLRAINASVLREPERLLPIADRLSISEAMMLELE